MPASRARGPGLVVGRRLVEQRVLAVAVDAEAEGEHDAAARQPVERRRLLGDELHAPPRQRRTIVPMRTRSVATATAASVTHGSANGSSVRFHRWSQTKTPSHPAASAVAATSATTPGSASSSDSDSDRPQRMPGHRSDRRR